VLYSNDGLKGRALQQRRVKGSRANDSDKIFVAKNANIAQGCKLQII